MPATSAIMKPATICLAVEEVLMKNKRYLTAADVAEFMDISVPMAYKIIRRLNDELSAGGYIVVAGRVSRSYFEQKIYGGMSV